LTNRKTAIAADRVVAAAATGRLALRAAGAILC